MSSPNVEGFGTYLQQGTSSAATGAGWTNLAQVVDLEIPKVEASDIKTTHMQSANHTHTFQAGLIEPGMSKVTIQFNASNEASLRALLRKTWGYQIIFSDGTTPTNSSRLTFDGYLKEIGPKAPMDDIVTEELTFKVSGLPVYTAAG